MKSAKSVERAVICRAVLACCVLGVACNSTPREPSGSSDVGSVGLALVLPSGATVNQLHWALLQMKTSGQAPVPVTVGGVALGGDISLETSGSTPSVAFGGPKGTMYVVKLSATEAGGGTRTCAGTSDIFAIDAGQVTKVTVALITCTTTAGLGDAGVSLTGKLDNCPSIVAAAASSLVVAAGATIQVSATATDVDFEPVTYSWKANEGTFDDAGAAVTKYHCPATPGLQTITLEVADHDGMVTGSGGAGGATAGAEGGAGGGSSPPANVPTTPAKCMTTAQVVVNCGLCGNGVLNQSAGELCDPPNGMTCDSVCQTIAGVGGAGGRGGAGGAGGAG